jgi:hypothetical protein
MQEWLPTDLLDLLASRPLDVEFSLREVFSDPSEPLHACAVAAVRGVPDDAIMEVWTDPRLGLARPGTSDRGVSEGDRLIVAAWLAKQEIYHRRCDSLQSQRGRPAPYEHPTLSDLQPDGDALVPLSAFDLRERRIQREGFVFHLVPPLPQGNSNYWLAEATLATTNPTGVRVRLDPLLVSPVECYEAVFYRMLLYGQSLDWDRIDGLRSVEHAQWMPDEMSSTGILRTDVQWSPRDGLVHFECEELPTAARDRPSRYFHSIYDPTQQGFIHADFAIRFYSDDELVSRARKHLKDIGKVGRRVKLLRIDRDLARDEWATILAGAFVWNNDLAKYVLGNREFLAEHSSVFESNPS